MQRKVRKCTVKRWAWTSGRPHAGCCTLLADSRMRCVCVRDMMGRVSGLWMESCFREEEEFEESDAAQSNRSQDGGSNHDIQGDSHSASLGEP